ncbi:MAG TPA: hypothetical protein VF331_08825 [Polyangiales bacterium]
MTFDVSSGVYTVQNAMFDLPRARSAPPSTAQACTGMQSGDCCYTPAIEIPSSAAHSTAPKKSTFGDAGPILLHDGAHKLGTLVFSAEPHDAAALAWSADYTYLSSDNIPDLKWNGGDTLSAAANGGATVGAFVGSVVAPSPFEGLTPKFDYLGSQTNPLEIQRAKDFVVSWRPDTKSSSTIDIGLSASKATGSLATGSITNRGTISCTVKDSAGSVVVPAELLAKYETGDEGAVLLHRRNGIKLIHLDQADVTISATASEATFVSFK